MWHPGRTGRQPCGLQNICPDPAVFAAARFAGFCSWADAPVIAKTSAPAKIHFVVVIVIPPLFLNSLQFTSNSS